MIRAFSELDTKGVLLERVARPVRRYLRDRDDTARIIVASLLADVAVDSGGRVKVGTSHGIDISASIAAKMAQVGAATQQQQQYADHDTDFANMDWTPDPVDAGPEFRKTHSSNINSNATISKTDDILSHLFSLYERDALVAELKTILGEHLLLLRKSDEDPYFEKETRLMEMFRLRLGEDKLQAVQVMLRDVEESARLNGAVWSQSQQTQTVQEGVGTSTGPRAAVLSTRILSSYFWPALRPSTFAPPAPIAALQRAYEMGFERIKDMRKLRWLSALGRVEVVLELEDREIEVECQTWQASVIYAFQGSQETWTVQGLETDLEMENELVTNGLTFWVAKRVLRETETDTYAVIENLSALSSSSDNAAAVAAAAATAEAEAAVSAVKSQEDLLMENMQVYAQFVMGMLTNGGAMPAGNVHMMLKMALQDGFQFGVEDVRVLLGRMEDEGVLERRGEVWGVRK